MLMATQVAMSCWLETLQQLGWSERCVVDEPQLLRHAAPSDCWFRASLTDVPGEPRGRYRVGLNRQGRAAVARFIEAGWSLRPVWPRPWHPSVAQWLGERLVLGHASLFSSSTPLFSLVSSQLGRHGYRYPQWPSWIDGALRRVRRDQGRLLLTPGSTLTDNVEYFAARAALPVVKVCWEENEDVSRWLYHQLANLQSDKLLAKWDRGVILLSPEMAPATETFKHLPLQDRVSLALADRVLALSVRRGGKLYALVRQRLHDPLYPLGSLFITLSGRTISGTSKTTLLQPQGNTEEEGWLSQGAVGWVVHRRQAIASTPLRHCRSWISQPLRVQQWTSPLPAAWKKLKPNDDWDYLVHCTRGISGPLIDESLEHYRERVWLSGEQPVWHPLETLAHICQTGYLRATAKLTRTAARCVSWSAVPLSPLLQRRTFRSHLGRWDWEPYGFLVQRDALRELGIREVIYGDEHEYGQLAESDRPYFQPRQRRAAASAGSWSEEREWRVPGDVPLHALPADSILVFVRTQSEANQCSRYSPWPLLWVQ
jgi:hypothetical protein